MPRHSNKSANGDQCWCIYWIREQELRLVIGNIKQTEKRGFSLVLKAVLDDRSNMCGASFENVFVSALLHVVISPHSGSRNQGLMPNLSILRHWLYRFLALWYGSLFSLPTLFSTTKETKRFLTFRFFCSLFFLLWSLLFSP